MLRDVRRAASAATLVLGLLAALPALAAPSVNKTLFGTAVEGYDVVAYFTEGKPVKGARAYSYDWKGATWRFSSAAHRDLFAANPAKYAPQYGGFCAYAVSQGATAGIDPTAWKIHDGKLFLNLNAEIQARWLEDVPGYVAKADAHWPALSGETRTIAANPCNPCAAKANPCAASANPCAAKANPCAAAANPCARKTNPCARKTNPCAAKANPCAGKTANPCNPCAGKRANPCSY